MTCLYHISLRGIEHQITGVRYKKKSPMEYLMELFLSRSDVIIAMVPLRDLPRNSFGMEESETRCKITRTSRIVYCFAKYAFRFLITIFARRSSVS